MHKKRPASDAAGKGPVPEPGPEPARRQPHSPPASSEEAAAETIDVRRSATRVPSRIGRYTIQRVIASGGMGTVYKAVQEQPRRPVAVKVMKAGVTSASDLRRFEFEAQLLGRLRHPGIAQIYEAGTHEEGGVSVPYFAMEYIPNAKSITRYAREKELGVRDRLALFQKVCEAVHHGHQKGIIHRDVKPENILVGPNGTPRIIDFGVARATDSDMAVTLYQTDLGQLVGTLQYMSPEQCEADPHDIDTRSDVYSLGVVLYELLCGQLPYDVGKKPVYEAAAMIRSQDPLRPSKSDPKLRGDLETIVLKALEKERDRRYQSAAELAQDIARYLQGEAITARPASSLYQMRVLARRHRGFLSAAAVVGVVLVIGAVVSTSLYFKSRNYQVRAYEQEAKAEGAQMYLDDIMSSLNMIMGDEIPVSRLLETFEENIEERFEDDPEAEAAVRRHLAKQYDFLAMFRGSDESKEYARRAQANLNEALRIQRAIYGEQNTVTLASIEESAVHLGNGFDLAEAEAQWREAVSIRSALPNQDPDEIMLARLHLASVLIDRNELDEATDLNTEVFEYFRKRNEEDGSEDLPPGTSQRATILELRGDYAEAEKLRLALLKEAREDPDPESRSDSVWWAEHWLARLYVTEGKLDEAAAIFDTDIAATAQNFGIQEWLNVEHRLQPDAPTLLVFWEEWCPWCQLYIPPIERAWEEQGKRVQFVGLTSLSWNKTKDDALDFIERNGLGFPNAVYDAPTARGAVGNISYPMVIALCEGRMVWQGSARYVTPGFMKGMVSSASGDERGLSGAAANR